MATLQPNKDAEVSVVEQGIIKIYSDAQTGVSGVTTSTYTVPTGKVWKLKSTFIQNAGGFTAGDSATVRYFDGTTEFFLYSEDIGSKFNCLFYQPTNDLTFQSGDVLRIITSLSAAETYNAMILVQEFDA